VKLSPSGARDVLLVKRFDRDKTQAGYRRARTVSALTTSNADFRERSDELPKLLKNN
jgi:serine/threonine-protein kinase HipA